MVRATATAKIVPTHDKRANGEELDRTTAGFVRTGKKLSNMTGLRSICQASRPAAAFKTQDQAWPETLGHTFWRRTLESREVGIVIAKTPSRPATNAAGSGRACRSCLRPRNGSIAAARHVAQKLMKVLGLSLRPGALHPLKSRESMRDWPAANPEIYARGNWPLLRKRPLVDEFRHARHSLVPPCLWPPWAGQRSRRSRNGSAMNSGSNCLGPGQPRQRQY